MLDRLCFVDVHHAPVTNDFPRAVAEGLAAPQKTLPCRYFYDERGSELFERICELPEYYLTRTERRLLEQHAADIVAAVGSSVSLVEFGSGSSCKTRLLFDAFLAQQPTLHYTPIDISRDFLRQSAHALLADYPELHITALAAEYGAAMDCLPDSDLPRLFLFLGSNIGNFAPDHAAAFLQNLHRVMRPEDRLLLGVDLVKSRGILEAAYNDAQGVTATFNLNLLHRINQELGANFDPEQFRHHAPFVAEHTRVEMHLISRRAQTVHIAALNQNFSFADGEIIHTENSHKYTPQAIAELCGQAGMRLQSVWTDNAEQFAAVLLQP